MFWCVPVFLRTELQVMLCFTMKLIDFAFTSHFSSSFLQEISPGNFLFFHEILNFTLRQFLHETRNMCFYLYKHCILYFFVGCNCKVKWGTWLLETMLLSQYCMTNQIDCFTEHALFLWICDMYSRLEESGSSRPRVKSA